MYEFKSNQIKFFSSSFLFSLSSLLFFPSSLLFFFLFPLSSFLFLLFSSLFFSVLRLNVFSPIKLKSNQNILRLSTLSAQTSRFSHSSFFGSDSVRKLVLETENCEVWKGRGERGEGREGMMWDIGILIFCWEGRWCWWCWWWVRS